MPNLRIAIIGDINPGRTFTPAMSDPAKAKKAAEDLGAELARRGARLQVYGGPYLEEDVVRGYVAGQPAKDHGIMMWYTIGQEPKPFPEEGTHPKLFERRSQRGTDWEVAFYRSVTRADGVILMGGGKATLISGQVAIGAHMPLLTLVEFGGAAATVWETLSAGEDLPNRDEIDLMARPWVGGSAAACVDALFNQWERRQLAPGAPRPVFSIIAGLLFLAALAIVPWVWGHNALPVWMLFLSPLLAGGAGATIRPMVDRQRGQTALESTALATLVLGLVAGGIAGVLFITAQLTADPKLVSEENVQQIMLYAQRSIPYAVGIGFVAGLTSDAVFSKLLGLDVVRSSGIGNTPSRP